MPKITHIIYPKETHPASRYLSLVGALFLTSLAILLITFGVIKLTEQNENLASISDSTNGTPPPAGTEITTSTAEGTPAARMPQATSTAARTATSTAQNPPPRTASLTPGKRTTTTYPVTSSQFISLPNGIPDLAVSIIDTGIVNDAGNFRHATGTNAGEQTGIVFEVKNIGTAESGIWKFTAELPTEGGNFTSVNQDSIFPGEKIQYTIGFRLLRSQGQNTAAIIIDPERQITKEVERGNNSIRIVVIRNY